MKNVEEVLRQVRQAEYSLDVGGWGGPINSATHVIDINAYETRLSMNAWDPGIEEKFDKSTWIQRDICDRMPWPFEDDYFDFTCCSSVLEDIRDPIWVVSEISRVSRSGYIECPSPGSELLMCNPLMSWMMRSRKGIIGNCHHGWLVSFNQEDRHLEFRFKSHDLMFRGRYVPYSSLHRVDYENFASWIFWEGDVTAEEVIFDLGEWIDAGPIKEARKLVNFDPIGRLRDKFLSMLRPAAESQREPQPHHGTDEVRYPYI